ncbi:hypothetical protein EON64_00345 [archaeon]|nr:MAG: hypothetical protein EON64_00345 [archaeon]
MMRHCNELMTYDSCALRVWNLQKPIKVVYHKESKEEKFLKMLPIEKLQCVALFFTRKAGDSISTVIKLVSRQLSTLQEVCTL